MPAKTRVPATAGAAGPVSEVGIRIAAQPPATTETAAAVSAVEISFGSPRRIIFYYIFFIHTPVVIYDIFFVIVNKR